MNKLIKLINEIHQDQESFFTKFPRIELKGTFDLSGFNEQASGIDGVDVEYVNQSGCGDFGYHGTIAIPYEDFLIVFDYSE